MAKKVTGYIKLQIPAAKATPAPPVGPALGQHGVNICLLYTSLYIKKFLIVPFDDIAVTVDETHTIMLSIENIG